MDQEASMARKGHDFFIAEPDSGEERHCRVCNAPCKAMRNVFGPTGFVSAMAKKFTYHDEFVCPHTDEPWHQKALQLAVAIDDTPSKRLADLMRADLLDILNEHLRD
jgi:hypothetical protein